MGDSSVTIEADTNVDALERRNNAAADPQRIGKALRRARMRLGLNQTQGAQLTGFARPILARIKGGYHEQRLCTLARIATAYGITVASLLEVSE
jgi:hypothetical protein